MENYVATPQLGFMEAVKLACSRLFNLNSRSRRSEFWWFMVAFFICSYILNAILSIFLTYLPATIASCLIMLFAVAVTARRLQDGGHSKWWVILSYIALTVYNIYVAQSDLMFEMMSVNPNPDHIIAELSNPVMALLSLANMVLSVPIFIFCLIDGKREPNQYGESPKYKLQNEI